ncbi:LacI family transcriptional regulator [Planococcus sp. MERTA32b]|nr:LacI family transcriptional regulator [Planococcus sp. MER TA 32b]
MVSSVDVAKLAGVSQATVSRVLNNPEKVNAPTLEKVKAAIQQLNYRPNAAARSLISRKSGIIALFCGQLDEPDNAEFANKAVMNAQQKGYTVEIHIQNPDKPESVFDAILDTQAEGIMMGPLIIKGTAVEYLKTSGIPYIFCGSGGGQEGITVGMDNHAAGKLAAEYISSLEPETVGWLGGDPSDLRLQERYQGFVEAMKESGVRIVKVTGDLEDIELPFTAMMAQKQRPDVIVAATDSFGIFALDFLYDYGYAVPEDVAVLGIGNSRQSAMNYLSLSSIGLPDDMDMVAEAFDRLSAMIENNGQGSRGSADVNPVVYERRTTKTY